MNSALRYRRWTDKPAYAVERMCNAVERLIDRSSRDEREHDAAWSVAWAVAAGAKPPANFELRSGHRTPHDMEMSLASRRKKNVPG